MACAEIKAFLSDYMDGILDADTKAVVDDHLAACQQCKEELETLRNMVEELGSLGAIEPPDDFLQQLHERIEQRSWYKRILHALFVPLRVKLPLELVGAATMVILAIAVLQVQKEEYHFAKSPIIATQQEKKAEKGVVDVEAVSKDQAPKSRVSSDSAPPKMLSMTKEPLELAILLKSELPEKAFEPETPKKAGLKKRLVKTLKTQWHVSGKETAEGSSVTDMPLRKSTAHPFPPYTKDAFSKVADCVALAEGDVISMGYENQDKRSPSILAEIPAENYSAFYGKLQDLGDMDTPHEFPFEPDQDTIRVRIRLLPPK